MQPLTTTAVHSVRPYILYHHHPRRRHHCHRPDHHHHDQLAEAPFVLKCTNSGNNNQLGEQRYKHDNTSVFNIEFIIIIIMITTIIITISMIIIIIMITRPRPAFGRLGLGGSSGGYSSCGKTSHASLRACGAQLGGKQ